MQLVTIMPYICAGCEKTIDNNNQIGIVLNGRDGFEYLHLNSVNPDGSFIFPEWEEEKNNPLSCYDKYHKKANWHLIIYPVPSDKGLEESVRELMSKLINVDNRILSLYNITFPKRIR